MAFTSRGKRDLTLPLGTTGSEVGPGSYTLATDRSHGHGYAPFMSTTPREFKAEAAESGPAPGSYNVTTAPAKKVPVSISSRTSRFKSKQGDNPGPGQYETQKAMSIGSKNAKQQRTPRTKVSDIGGRPVEWTTAKSAPSIPRGNQTFGYVDDEQSGNVVPQRPPSTDDTLGPAYYSQTGPASSGPAPAFSKSKTQRKVFEPKEDNPAPGEYNLATDILSGKQKFSKGHSSSFQSGIPRFTETAIRDAVPGPGEYNTRDPFASAQQPLHKQHFGSTSRRTSDIDPTSIYAPQSVANPGPGSYAVSSAFTGPRQIGRKRAVFGSTSARSSNIKGSTPGPGSYSLPDPTAQAVLNRQGELFGAFGSTTGRFSDPGTHESLRTRPMKKALEVEDPERLDTNKVERSVGRSCRRPANPTKPSSIFKSKTERTLSKTSDAPPPGYYNSLEAEKALRNPKQMPKTKAGFLSQSAREQPVEYSDDPAPGSYDVSKPLTKRTNAFNQKSSRFHHQSTSATPGPGQYDLATTLVKPSYNISVDHGKEF